MTNTETPTKSLASRLSQYAYSPTASPTRRSTRSTSALTAASPRRNAASASPVTPRTPAKRARRSARRRPRKRPAAPSASPRKKPRPYADPSRYAHLSGLPQILRPGLDAVFCGINPGKKSATTGHHFAHPTNKFWKALHGSGMSARLLVPAEDVTLPDEYNFGMTNLIERPTAEQSELSPLEMRLAVAPFTRRVASHGPRVVCFVGKGIWDIFAGVVGRSAVVAEERGDVSLPNGEVEGDELEDDVKDEAEAEADELDADDDDDVKPDLADEEAATNDPLFLPRDATPKVVRYTLSNGGVKREPPDEAETKPTAAELDGVAGEAAHEPEDTKPTADDLEEMAANDAPSSPLTEVGSPTPPPPPAPPPARAPARRQAPRKPPPFSYDGPQRFRLPLDDAAWPYTYFWVVPNTSGLERTPLAEQIVLFGKLRAFVELLKAGGRPEPPASGFLDIDLAGVGATVASMRDDAIAKGKMAPE
ncbi:hypothetical protein VHUM_02562 [Vanrija humicola]|uniref:Uracil-DNA glycosylase-like domain-containing protein n=1 Tax=Vanrija humicola TaxID=5417 RepID=A0A7D8V1P2_VANHU|nr:hypothetical protein VHUM_02562 [Vanrija humicola]